MSYRKAENHPGVTAKGVSQAYLAVEAWQWVRIQAEPPNADQAPGNGRLNPATCPMSQSVKTTGSSDTKQPAQGCLQTAASATRRKKGMGWYSGE